MANAEFNDFITQFSDAVKALNVTIADSVALLLIILFGLIIGKLLGKLVKRLLSELQLDRRLKLGVGDIFSVEGFVSGLVSWFFYIAAFLMVLNKLGIMTYVVNGFFGIMIAVIIIILLLGMKDIIPNMISGFQLRRKITLMPGKRVIIGHTKGVIEEVHLTTLNLRGTRNELIVVPYRIALHNITLGTKDRHKK
jgi:small-conductance mechanosensitive channel